MIRIMQGLFGWSIPLASSSADHGRTLVPVLLASLALMPLCGCAAKRLKVDFTGFEKAYAETSNRELLLNLARLENRDPTYFFKIGQITSAYKMAASVTGNGSYAVQSSDVLRGGPTGGGIAGVNYENDPIFTFIPVNDETNAQLLLKPVPAETFYFLYEQGWRVDQLVRVMVDRLELTRYDTKTGTCSVETYHNVPPTVYLNKDGSPDFSYDRDPDSVSGYVTFLRISAVVYWLQKHGYLVLRGAETFVPYEKASGIPDNDAASVPKGSDFVNAAQKGAVWEDINGKWLLGEKVFSPSFTLYPRTYSSGEKALTANDSDIRMIEDKMKSDPDMKELAQGPALYQTLQILAAGFAIEGGPNQPGSCNPASNTSSVSAHLIMRSLIGLMAAAAQEQAPFDTLAQSSTTIPPSSYLPEKDREAALQHPRTFVEEVPAIERIPLLRLTGTPVSEETQPIIELEYRGTKYRISDEKSLAGTDNQYWNRDVFRLINQLTSQVTVDISKFPLTEILQ
jgi:hypothetical protein